ncbi:hypothetical protein PIIN_08628 [Serendipita indica DSM 11827]|uniref:F-box domain-containing protein n=1 Tax=Serendipita indica (strain DSM 11827) TaxID=1109443 RepID=G4TTN4_SERID|nr:hypothetical protein PIIN_08628 [Serendipita indica DSM 11827]
MATSVALDGFDDGQFSQGEEFESFICGDGYDYDTKPYPEMFSAMPLELLRLILYEAALDSTRNRSRLMRVCSLWRDTMVHIPYLWTDLCISGRFEPKECFKEFIWWLDVQIGRTKSCMLDVEWDIRLSEEQTAILFTWIAKRAPSSRWRSLLIRSCEYVQTDDAPLGGLSDFRNLESLIVYHCAPYQLLYLVNQSITSKLTHVTCRGCMDDEELSIQMSSILKCISTLSLTSFELDTTIVLPENINEITIERLPFHTFPHITSLITTRPNALRLFAENHFPNLQSISTRFTRLDCWDIPMRLSSLTTLIISGDEFEPLALVTLPRLRILCIRPKISGQESHKEAKRLCRVFMRADLSLCPTEVLEMGTILPYKVLAMGIARMAGKTRKIAVCVKRKNKGRGLMTRIFASQPTPMLANYTQDANIAPCLQSLEFFTSICITEESEKDWRDFMVGILQARRSLESIKAVWADGPTTSVARMDNLL